MKKKSVYYRRSSAKGREPNPHTPTRPPEERVRDARKPLSREQQVSMKSSVHTNFAVTYNNSNHKLFRVRVFANISLHNNTYPS